MIYLAKKVGFQNINDCLYTAIAETHCSELYTFNKSDFKRIGAFGSSNDTFVIELIPQDTELEKPYK